MDAPAPLQPVREDWDRALVVVAHPDDMEFGAAAAVARWTGQGKHVAYALVTSGEAGIDGLEPARSRVVREAEQRASCAVVRVDEVEFLGLPDGMLEYGLPLRRAVCGTIRRHRPEIVITSNFCDTWGGTALNQADHIAVGRATLDAVRDAANRWVFAEQILDGLERWDGVREVWASSSPDAGHAVDTTDTFEVGLHSLEAHREYIDGLGYAFEPREFLEGTSRPVGTRLGTRFGAAFEVFTIKDDD